MSEARRTADALTAAHENVKTAVYAAGRNRARGESGSFMPHITDLEDLIAATVTIHYLTDDLATIVKSVADHVRARYVHERAPNGGEWPTPLKEAAGDADRALSKLRSHLNRTPAHAGHDTLSVLHGFLHDLRRATSQRQ